MRSSGSSRKTVLGRELPDPLPSRGRVEQTPAAHGFGTEHDVLSDGQRVHEHEVLMDHPDARADGVGRAVALSSLPRQQDLPAVGPARVRRGPS